MHLIETTIKLSGLDGQTITPKTVKMRTLFEIICQFEEMVEAAASDIRINLSDVPFIVPKGFKEGSLLFEHELDYRAQEALSYLEKSKNIDGNFSGLQWGTHQQTKKFISNLSKRKIQFDLFKPNLEDKETPECIILTIPNGTKVVKPTETPGLLDSYTTTIGTCRSIDFQNKNAFIHPIEGGKIKIHDLSQKQIDILLAGIKENAFMQFRYTGILKYDPTTLKPDSMPKIDNIEPINTDLFALRGEYSDVMNGISVSELMSEMRGDES